MTRRKMHEPVPFYFKDGTRWDVPAERVLDAVLRHLRVVHRGRYEAELRRIIADYVIAGATRGGGLKGAEIVHGTPAERQAQHDTWRVVYARFAEKFPEAGRMKLLRLVGDEFGVAASTVATWVPNPTQTRRGRPRKK